jgi:hypothetical protein
LVVFGSFDQKNQIIVLYKEVNKMPRFTVRMTEAQRDALAEKARLAGLSDSDIARKAIEEFEPEEVTMAPPVPRPTKRMSGREETLRQILPYLQDWAGYVQAWGQDRAERLLLERLDTPLHSVPLRKVAVGEPVLWGGEIYVVVAHGMPGPDDTKTHPQPFCALRPVGGDETIRVDAAQIVVLPGRLDDRLPPDLLDFTILEGAAVSVLSRGPQTLRELYPQVHARQGFDTSVQRISRGQISQLCGKLMWGLVANDLVTFEDGNPLVSRWCLTGRGYEASKFVSHKEVY